MDPELQRALLAPTPEQLASVKVFPLILSLKKEVTVCQLDSHPSRVSEDDTFKIVL